MGTQRKRADGSLRQKLTQAEQRYVSAKLHKHGGCKAHAAKDLGITHQCLNMKLNKWGWRGDLGWAYESIPPPGEDVPDRSVDLRKELLDLEQRHVSSTLHKHDGCKAHAARELGLTRQCLVWKLNKWGWTQRSRPLRSDQNTDLYEEDVSDVSDDRWVNAALLSCDANVLDERLKNVKKWLVIAEHYGHVSSASAMGLRSILLGQLWIEDSLEACS